MIRSTIVKTLLLLLLSCTEAFSSSRVAVRPTELQPSSKLIHELQKHQQQKQHHVAPLGSTVAPTGSAFTDQYEEPEVQEEGLLKKHPFASAVAITTVNAVVADLLTQVVFEAMPWNPKRSLLFAAFGFLYQGCAQYALVNHGWERLFPGNSKKNVISKICGMNLLSDPLLFMPTFYIFKETLTSGFTMATIKAALLSYKGNCLVDWRNSWLIWFPGHAVTYGVMAKHKRIPWIAFLSFFYMVILSITRGGPSL
jgi:protein Mpv17